MAGSYRRALQDTVAHYSGWRPDAQTIDALKSEGDWNNDWDASRELIRRRGSAVPERDALIDVFSGFYFGGDPEGDPAGWKGFIGDEPLLVDAGFFARLTELGCRWGFVSGAEPPSARFVLNQRLGLKDPALVAMGDAPDKPDPTGLIRLTDQLCAGDQPETVFYIGDTVADVHTVLNARRERPDRPWKSLAVAPPHVRNNPAVHPAYEARLKEAGADQVLSCTTDVLELLRIHPSTP